MAATAVLVVPARAGTGRPRRVLHVMRDLAIGGGQTIVWNGVRHADRERFEVRMCHLLEADEMAPAFEDCDVPVFDVGHRDRLGARTVARLVGLIRQQQVDLVHVHNDLDRKYAQAAALLTRTPVVGHLHAEWNHLAPNHPPGRPSAVRRARARALAGIRNAVERAVVRHYIAESARVRDLFAPLVGDTPITVLDQAIPTDRYDDALAGDARTRIRSELGIDPSAPVLVNVSRLVAGKGHEELLRILADVRDRVPEVVLVLVGDGDLRPALQHQARELGVSDAVRFTGSRNDVPDLLVAGDVFVFASESEGFGMALLEAMAASLPIVAFDLPAFAEFTRPGETALLVPLGDEEAFAAGVLALLADRARASAMGAAGRAVVHDRFDAAAVTRTFESVYAAVLDGTAHPTKETT